MKWVSAALLVLVALLVFRPRAETAGSDPPAPGAADLQLLRAAFEPFQRTAFDPETEDSDPVDPVSKFGGAPWLPEGVDWPVCPGCRTPMHFFAQVDVASLPAEVGAAGTGLIQLFLCIGGDLTNDVCLQTWQHRSAAQVVRLVDHSVAGANSTENSGTRNWPARRIVGWSPIPDWPHYEDWELAGLSLTKELEEAYDKAAMEDTAPYPRVGDKAGGWPCWVQGPEWGTCSECGERMRLILQIDSEDNLPFMFGDAGIGHVSQCPEHPGNLTWGWACH